MRLEEKFRLWRWSSSKQQEESWKDYNDHSSLGWTKPKYVSKMIGKSKQKNKCRNKFRGTILHNTWRYVI